MENPTYARLTSMHFHAWKQGLKTGCYYLRTKAPVMAQKFTVDPRLVQGSIANLNEAEDDSECESENEELTPEQKRALERAALKDRLSREYEQAVKEAREASANGEGCTMCSS
jgi:ribonucleotide reductase alpha subunit